ncbi:hypothetical protein D4765_15855 [Subtercola vilae]|uniref:Uncharacterized protein n=1 Tax=Subtercola vilae TaxID=2056433 RepID=A0A4V6U598_9MICO|nr:hypothetical protein D4765_15855 [Subtercola vilae]
MAIGVLLLVGGIFLQIQRLQQMGSSQLGSQLLIGGVVIAVVLVVFIVVVNLLGAAAFRRQQELRTRYPNAFVTTVRKDRPLEAALYELTGTSPTTGYHLTLTIHDGELALWGKLSTDSPALTIPSHDIVAIGATSVTVNSIPFAAIQFTISRSSGLIQLPMVPARSTSSWLALRPLGRKGVDRMVDSLSTRFGLAVR